MSEVPIEDASDTSVTYKSHKIYSTKLQPHVVDHLYAKDLLEKPVNATEVYVSTSDICGVRVKTEEEEDADPLLCDTSHRDDNMRIKCEPLT